MTRPPRETTVALRTWAGLRSCPTSAQATLTPYFTRSVWLAALCAVLWAMLCGAPLAGRAQTPTIEPRAALLVWLATPTPAESRALTDLRLQVRTLAEQSRLRAALDALSAGRAKLEGALTRDQLLPLYAAVGQLYADSLADYAQGKTYFARALEEANARGDGLAALALADGLVKCHIWLFEAEHALELAFDYRDRAAELNDTYYERIFSEWIGRALEIQGEWADALRHYERVRQLAFLGDDPGPRFDALLNLACTYYKSGAPQRGLDLMLQTYPYASGNAERAAVAQLWAGSMYNALGDYARAADTLARARAAFDRLGLSDRRIHTLMELGRTRQEQGRHQEAIALVDEAFALIDDEPSVYNELFGYTLRADAYRALGDYQRAVTNLDLLAATRTKLDSTNSARNIQNLTKRYELREREQTIEQQRTLLERRRYLGLALALAVALLAGALYALNALARNRRRLAEQNRIISEQAATLRELDTLKTDLYTNVAHELRTPLTLIMGPLQSVLRAGGLDQRATRQLTSAERGAVDLLGLIDNLLALARLDEGRMPIDSAPVALHGLLHQVVDRFRENATAASITLSLDADLPPGLVVDTDEDKVRSILNNLLGNALRFTPPGGSVTLQSATERDMLVLRVIDSGTGIVAEDLPHVFERYRQARLPGGRRQSGGSGVGLAVVASYAEAMGGRAAVESELGTGSTFVVHLPLRAVESPLGNTLPPDRPAAPYTAPKAPAHQASSAPKSRLSAPKALSTLNPQASTPSPSHLLVVEDHHALREQLRDQLAPNFRVTTAANGQEALDAVRADAPDLIVSDVMMPVMDGYELLRHLRSDPSTRPIPVVMLTARTDPAERREALRIGVDDYLHKPFDAGVLLHRIGLLLEQRRARLADTDEPGDPHPDTDASTTSPQPAESPLDARALGGATADESPHATLSAGADSASAKTEAPTHTKEPLAKGPLAKGPLAEQVSDAEAIWLESFEAYVIANLNRDVLSVPQLASVFAMSESSLLRQLKRLTGLPPARYVEKIRLAKARDRLDRYPEAIPLKSLARSVGYSNTRTFSRNFKAEFGVVPSEYQDALQQASEEPPE